MLVDAYDRIARVLDGLGEADWAAPTRTDWTVRELTFHLLLDQQRALVALASTTDADPDVDAVTYWRAFDPEAGDGGAAHAEFVRRAAAAYAGSTPSGLVAQWRATATAAGRAALAADPSARVETQGHVLTVTDLVSTLVVEAAVHHLDLVAGLRAPGPSEASLAEVRRVLEALLGEPFPAPWDDTTVALVGTGRRTPDAAEAAELGRAAHRLPLLG